MWFYVGFCFYPCGCLIQQAMMMLPIVFSVTAALEETHGAQKLRKFTTQYCLGGIWMLYWRNCYISGNPPNLCQDFEIIYPNAPEILVSG
jgi:sodium-dependent dicarboxylate transporter 2/3/5